LTAPDAGAFRRAAGRFPTGIVVVATSVQGTGHAMTVSAFTSVSLDPLLVLFCAEKIARFHDAVLAAGIWSVSVLDEEAEKAARWLATRGRPLDGQLDMIAHHRWA
jgi:flavin reductase (DIM6/NTAB) family NADH-FMN oxidoreductase RutF